MLTQLKPILLLSLLIAMVQPILTTAQVEVKWEKAFSGNIQWQKITTLGNLFIITDKALRKVDPETGELLWSKEELAGISSNAFEEVPGSPFFKVTGKERVLLIDQFKGTTVFDSKREGVPNIDEFFMLYDLNLIVVSGEDKKGDPLTLGVRMADGAVRWKLTEKMSRVVAASSLGNDELLIVNLFDNVKVNAKNGEIIWKKANSAQAEALEKMGGFGSFLKDLAENMADEAIDNEGSEVIIEFYKKPNEEVFFIASQVEDESFDRIYHQNTYNAYNAKTGELLWEEYIELNGKLGPVVLLDHGMLLMPDTLDRKDRSTLYLQDYKTGKGQWGKRGRGIDVMGSVYNYFEVGDQMILATYAPKKRQNYLVFLNPKTGELIYEDPTSIEGRVMGVFSLPNALMYLTTESVNILDLKTGNLKWAFNVNARPDLTDEYNGKIYAYDTKSKIVKAIDSQTGELVNMTTAALAFQGGESPKKLEAMEDGVVLYSDQNIIKYNYDGSEQFSHYFQAPKESGWTQALLYAGAVFGALTAADSYYKAGQLASVQDDVSKESKSAGRFVGQVSDAYADYGDSAADFVGEAIAAANARKKASASGKDRYFIMTKPEKEVVLKVISKTSGEVLGDISLGSNREPNYSVDPITGQVYLWKGEDNLISYKTN